MVRFTLNSPTSPSSAAGIVAAAMTSFAGAASMLIMLIGSSRTTTTMAFQQLIVVPPRTAATTSGRQKAEASTTLLPMSSNDYLSSLSSVLLPRTVEAPAAAAASSPPSSTSGDEDAADPTTFSHAPFSYFSVDKLTPKGPRKNADVGEPHDATRMLAKAGPFSCGSWWCAEGGWPSPALRETTEVFYVFDGRGCVTDLDGKKHHFGPGDTVILPKGWSGRWDIMEAIHKVWFVYDHPIIEETDPIIRAVITPYSDLVPEHLHEPDDIIHGSSPSVASKTIYHVGPTQVGCSTCTPCSFEIVNPVAKSEGFHVVQGVFFLTNTADGTSRRCAAGDTVLLPKGWTGFWDVMEPMRTIRVVVE